MVGQRWLRVQRLPAGLLAVSGLISLGLAIPLIYVAVRSLGGGVEVWQRLLHSRLSVLLANTLVLAAAVTLLSSALGVMLAILVERTDLPGRRVWRWLLAAPLAIPPFIGAIVYAAWLRPVGGILPRLWPDGPFPSPFGMGGAAVVLSLFAYPYVYLLAASALQQQHAAYDETARAAGLTAWQALRRVSLPMLRPGIGAGALLVTLDVLAEYGTVAYLRVQTFSAAIFQQLNARYDRSAAAALSAVLVALAVIVLWSELRAQGQARYEQVGAAWRPARPAALGRWALPALFVVGLVVVLSLVLPVGTLIVWLVQGVRQQSFAAQVYRTDTAALLRFALNSIGSAGAAGLVAVLLSLPVAYLSVRFPRRLTRALSRTCQLGYALPGVVVALGLVLVINRWLPAAYGSPMVVVAAYVIRHMPQAVRGSEAALAQVAPGLEEAARSLGRRPLRAFIDAVLPVIVPGLLATGALVFLTSLKELPATLLLRPAGFDTLAVRVWLSASEGVYSQAAAPALLLVLCAVLPLTALLRPARTARIEAR